MGQVSSQRGVDCSSGSGPCLYARRGKEKKEGRRKKSEAYVIYTRKGHVWGTDHKWDKPVSETTNHNWYYYKEDYNEGMGRDDDIIDLVISEKSARLAEFCPNE